MRRRAECSDYEFGYETDSRPKADILDHVMPPQSRYDRLSPPYHLPILGAPYDILFKLHIVSENIVVNVDVRVQQEANEDVP